MTEDGESDIEVVLYTEGKRIALQRTRGKAHCVSGGMRAELMVESVSKI